MPADEPRRHERVWNWIQIASVGYEQLLGLGLAARGVRACNARGVFDTAIAEWNVAMMINLARDLRGMIRNQERGVWDRVPPLPARRFAGTVVGLWGYGGIGRETARLAKALGMTVHVLTRGGVGPRRDTYTLPGTATPTAGCPTASSPPGRSWSSSPGSTSSSWPCR